MKDILPSLLAFPTSGASAMASPNLALGGYGSSMALSAPAANGTYVKHGKARTRNTKSGMRVCHREYIQDIVFGLAGDYENVVALPINPGNTQMFPWLASIANRFETYSFRSLRFIYEPQCGTENEGTVMIAVDFDAVDPAPVDKLQFMTYDGAVRSPPWFASVYECAKYNLHKYKQYYITKDLVTPLSTDEKTYFVGNLFVATLSQADPFTAGELYVEYDIELSTPQLSDLASVAGFYMQNARLSNGTYTTPTYAAGELDVMIDFFSPNSYLNATYVIPNPGTYLVTMVAQNSVGTVGVSLLPMNPPVGISEASIIPLVTDVDFADGSGISLVAISNLNDVVWFKVVSSFSGVSAAPSICTLYITPIDSQGFQALKQYFTPPIAMAGTRMQRLLHMKEVSHRATRRTRLPPRLEAKPQAQTVVEEVTDDNQSVQLKRMSATATTPQVSKPAVLGQERYFGSPLTTGR